MKIKVSEATPLQLNWLVAKCEGALMPIGNVMLIGTQLFITVGGDWAAYGKVEYSPSSDWSQAGPIIEREEIATDCDGATWCASYNTHPTANYGPTPLIAAMRCYVTSKLGGEVEIPEELA